MVSKLFKRTVFLAGLLLVLVSSYSLIYASSQKSVDNGVSLYVNYGNGFEYLTKLYFEKSVTEQSVMVNESITALRVVRGECYDFNLDRVTLNGISPVGYERKLSKADNDLLEVGDKIDFELEGKGELVISARAPETVQGEDYSIKFPKYNIGGFKSSSYFYKYELNSNNEVFNDSDELQIPSHDSFFISEMCYPDSGHPDAPIDFYVANDDDYLYVFFEAFVDNTLDHGKDFAGVHIKCGDEIKSYKVYTTEENEYGRWWFEYTDSSNKYNWQHMNYLVKIPMSEITTNSDSLEIAFEYYGTVSAQELLERLGVGEVYYITQEMLDNDIAYANEHEWAERYYDDECIRILPEPGKTSNANSGDTKEGEWWLTNTGTHEKPEYTLYLNNTTLHSSRKYWHEAIIAPYGSITICLVDGTTNTIVASKDDRVDYGIDAQATLDLNITGNGTLNVVANCALYGYGNLTISNGAVVNTSADRSTYDEAIYFAGNITLDNGTLRAGHSRAESQYEAYSFGVVCGGDIALSGDSILEVISADGDDNYGLAIESLERLNYDADIAVIKEGNIPEDAEEVDELTRVSENPYYHLHFGSKPYVLIEQQKAPEPTEDLVWVVKNGPLTIETEEEELALDFWEEYGLLRFEAEEEDKEITNYSVYNNSSNKLLFNLNYSGDELIITIADDVTSGDNIVYEITDEDRENISVLAPYKTAKLIFEIEEIAPVEEKCTITFDANGGSGTMDQVEVIKGSIYKLPTCNYTAPSNKTFDKWDLGKKGAEITVNENTTLVAQWKNKSTSSGGGSGTPSSYKITTKVDNGTITPENPKVKRKADQELTFKANDGYEITDVLVDGKSVGVVESYKLEKVTGKHTIEVKTAKVELLSNVDDWALVEMTKAEEKGLIPETFEKVDATKAISRKDFAAVAVKLYEALTGKTAEKVSNNPFTDTDDEYVLKAYSLGITKGVSDTEFGNGTITREQMATMIDRTLQKAGINLAVNLENVTKFVDDNQMHDWGRPSVYAMASKEIVRGVGENRFNPLGNAKVEEALAIALRCIGLGDVH